MRFRSIADTILAVLLAPPCALRGDVLRQPLNGAVCERCWAAVHLVPSCFFPANIARAQALGPYEGTLRDLIHALKYDGRRSIGPGLARLMTHYGASVLSGADCVVPVPLHRRRLRQRGFNQAGDLARGLGLPVVRALKRVRATTPQIELPADLRRVNMRDAFSPRTHRWGHGRTTDGRIVVLVDDVTTTGATLEACARALKQAGAKEIRALTAARVVL